MGINLDKMRAKLNAVQNRGGGSKKSAFWRPEDGEQTIRILPTADGDPFKEFFFHYNLGKNAGFLSPKKNFGEDDPLDGFIRQLFNEGTEESTKMAKSLMARQRFFSPVIVRGQEEEGVKVWGYGKQVYEQLLNLVLNPEYGDITDPNEGTDLLLSYGKPAGASFPQTKLMPSRKTSQMCKDLTDDSCKELLDSIPDFNSLFERKTPEDVQQMLDEYLAGDNAEELSAETTRYGGNSSSSNTTTASGGSTVDDAFKELLGS
tara:strand:- start:7605 stop:8387 length:783 start_codon:yes stop_codon:yes gene_type:complete